MLSGKVPRFFQRKNSGRRARKEETPVVASRALSPVSEDSAFSVPASDAPRPIPPPQHFHQHADQFEHQDMHHEDYEGGPNEPHSRLYETFTMSEDSRPPVPMVIREGDEDEHLHRYPDSYPGEHLHDYPGDHRSDGYADELGFANTERSGQDRPILIAPSSERSHSSQSSGQRVTFLGDLRSHDRGTPSVHRKALSASSRSMGSGDRPRAPFASSSLRNEYIQPRRHVSDPIYRPRRAARPEGFYEQQLPYMIFVDYGDGLEIGNEVDGFMPYTDYIATAHLRRTRENTYYIIPGSTPVIFNDENGRELYRVDARKYNTPTLRSRKYIIEDEFGNEICRIGNFNRDRGNPFTPSQSPDGYSSGSHSSRSKTPRVMYINSDNGSLPRRPKYKNKRPARSYHAPTPLTRSALFEDDRTESSESSAPDIVVVNEDGERVFDSRDLGIQARSSVPHSQYATEISYPNRSDSIFVDEHGRPVNNASHYSRGYPWASSSTESDEESYEDSRRHSQVFYT